MAAATERVVLLMSPDEKAWLAGTARRAGVSNGEFVRRLLREHAADAEFQAKLAQRRPEFEALLDQLEASTDRAHAAIDAALAEAERTRQHFARQRAPSVTA